MSSVASVEQRQFIGTESRLLTIFDLGWVCESIAALVPATDADEW